MVYIIILYNNIIYIIDIREGGSVVLKMCSLTQRLNCTFTFDLDILEDKLDTAGDNLDLEEALQ